MELREPLNPAEAEYVMYVRPTDGSAGAADSAAADGDVPASMGDDSAQSSYVTIDGGPTALDVAQRSGQYELQGNNELGFEGTCGLASMAEMVGDQLGEQVAENDIVIYASENALCATEADGVPADVRGGTTVDDRHQILDGIEGIQAERVEGGELDALAAKVEAGEGVLAAVKAGEYSNDSDFRSIAQAEYGTDHVVWVTGVVRDESSRLTGFTVNDTGRPDGAELHLDRDQMLRAWQDRGGVLNVAHRSDR